MKHVVSAEEMRWCDETAIKKYGIPGLLLMENAGQIIADEIHEKHPSLESRHILVLCGKGNNGGDGFVIARKLYNSGAVIDVLLMVSPSQLKGDAKTNFKILQKLTKKSKNQINIRKYSNSILSKLSKPDIIIDAIFGTGFSGSVHKPLADVINWVNNQRAKVYAVDIPSGVNGTTGEVENCAVHADVTITLGGIKSGLLCNQGRTLVGELIIGDIGIPHQVLEDKSKSFLVELSDVKRLMPKRPIHAHKYSVGKVLVLAGSKGLTGAAALCCNSAYRAGTGAVSLGTPEPVYPILAKKLTETMVFPLPATDSGSLSAAAFEKIKEKLLWADVLVIGPGLSMNPETQQLILKILLEYSGRILIDADGLNAIAETGISKIKKSNARFILTPHVGEFSRLSKLQPKYIEENRLRVAREMSIKEKATIVLKGVPTVTASCDGAVYINSTGNPGMATAGAGDVLSGIIAGLWAQGMTDVEAAFSGVYLHGLSGDIAAKKFGERGIVAGDIAENLFSAMQKVEA